MPRPSQTERVHSSSLPQSMLTVSPATLITQVSYLQNLVYFNRSAFCDSIESLADGPTNSSTQCPLQPGTYAFGMSIPLTEDFDFGSILAMIQVLSPAI